MSPSDLKIEAERDQYQGGQHVGTGPTGVWVTHVPTNLKAFCNFERSQLKNRNAAIAMIEYGLAEIKWDV